MPSAVAAKWKFAAPPKALAAALAEKFSDRPERVSTKPVDRAIYGRDLWPRELLRLRQGIPPEGPAAIVLAREARDVSDAVSLARELSIPLVPYSGGSGVCGGAFSVADSLLVDLKGLNQIRRIDAKSGLVEAEGGVNGEKLERELNHAGFTLGHFPSSIYCSTLGGWLAARSAGQLSTKYGKIEDMVVSLEAVLPDGSLIRTPEVPRSSAGPDFKQLLVGSEGTLGVIIAATLRIHRYPEHREFFSFAFPTWDAACGAVREVLQQDLKPAVVRLYDEADTQINAAHLKLPIKGILGVFVSEGEKRLTEFEARAVGKVCEAAGGSPLGEAPARRWWDHRYDVSYNLSKVLPNAGMILDTMEVAATWKNLPALYAGVRAALSKGSMMVLCHLSHAYLTGASLYFSVVARAKDEASVLGHYDGLWKGALDAALEAGGTVSHHHGVGRLKGLWMVREHEAFQELFAGVKERLDPKGLFNPGNLGLGMKPSKPVKRAAAKKPKKRKA
ncbi:MAG: FAD-binding oxidoreductase [Bdellovibrionota bacterium]